MAADKTHHEPRAGSGVASRASPVAAGASQSGAIHAPGALAAPRYARAELAAGRAGAQYVLAFKQSFDRGLSDAEQTENQCAMRNGLVAGRAQATRQAARARGAKRRRLEMRVGH